MPTSNPVPLETVPMTQPVERHELSSSGLDTTPHMPPLLVVRLSYLLLLVTLCVLWVMQGSINAYWQQTYHRVSPLVQLEGILGWQSGQQVGRWLNQQAAQSNNLIYTLSMQTNAYFNQCCLSEPVLSAHATPPVSSTTQAIVPVIDPNRVSLSSGDEVFFGGDSLMQGVAPVLQKQLLADYQIHSTNLSKQSTGLSYSSFFDWPKTVEQAFIDHPNTRLVVMFLGPNDPWDIPNPDKKSAAYIKFQSPEWERIYRAKIKRIINAVQQHSARLIWLGPPNMKKDKLNQQMIYLTSVIKDEIQANGAIYVDTRQMMGSQDNSFADFVLNAEQQKTKVRTGDGIHFSAAGVKILAEQIAARILFVPKAVDQRAQLPLESQALAAVSPPH